MESRSTMSDGTNASRMKTLGNQRKNSTYENLAVLQTQKLPLSRDINLGEVCLKT